MGELSLKDKIKDKISDLLFYLFLKINGYTEKQYYQQWVGYTQEEFEQRHK